MTRFWFPLLIAAAMLCCLIAYLRAEAREQAEWDSVCDQIAAQAGQPVKARP